MSEPPFPQRPPRPDEPGSDPENFGRPPRPEFLRPQDDATGNPARPPRPEFPSPGAEETNPISPQQYPQSDFHAEYISERPELPSTERSQPSFAQKLRDIDPNSFKRKIKNKVLSVKTIRPTDLLWMLRSWWRRSGWFGRVLGIMIAFLMMGIVSNMLGCNQKRQTPKQVLQQSGNDPKLAQIVDQTIMQTQSTDYVRSVNPDMNLKVIYQSDPRLIAVYAGSDLSAVDADKNSWQWGGRCWKKIGKGQEPSPLLVALPLSEKNVLFMDPIRKGQTWTVPFRAENLGSWRAGDGKLVIRNNRLEEFTYQTDDGAPENRFLMSYPTDAKPIKIDPQC